MLCDDIRFLTGRALWETQNLIAGVPDELWNKRYDGIPMWKFIYHMLYSKRVFMKLFKINHLSRNFIH